MEDVTTIGYMMSHPDKDKISRVENDAELMVMLTLSDSSFFHDFVQSSIHTQAAKVTFNKMRFDRLPLPPLYEQNILIRYLKLILNDAH